MYEITMLVDAPAGSELAIKESLAVYCEKHGDTRVTKIKEIVPKQLEIGGIAWEKQKL